MALDDAVDDGEPQAVARGLGGLERLEEAVELLFGDARARVLEGDRHVAIVGAEVDFESAAVLHGLHGVLDDVEEDLLHLLGVGHDGGQGPGMAHGDVDAVLLDVGLHGAEGILQDLQHVAGGEFGLARAQRAQELRENEVEPGDLVARDGDELGDGLAPGLGKRMQFALEELEVDAQRVEQVADLVRDAGGEQPHGLHPLGLDERGLVLALARDVAEDGDDARSGALGPLLHRHGVHLEDAPLRAGHLDLARGELRPFALLAPRQALPVHVGHVARHGASPHAGDLEAEQRLRGVVRVEEPTVRGHDHDALLDRLEDRLQQAALAHEVQELRLEVFGIQTIHPGNQLVEKSTLRRHAINSNGRTVVRLIGPQSSQSVSPRQEDRFPLPCAASLL